MGNGVWRISGEKKSEKSYQRRKMAYREMKKAMAKMTKKIAKTGERRKRNNDNIVYHSVACLYISNEK